MVREAFGALRLTSWLPPINSRWLEEVRTSITISTWSTGIAGSTLWNSSVPHVSPRGKRTLSSGVPLSFGSTNKHRERPRQFTRSDRKVACRPVTAGRGGAPDDENPSQQVTSQDWQYLAKLLAGCTTGAGLIKYGSILLPQISTQPDLALALLVITTPVVVSVVLLSAASSKSSGS